MILNGNLTKYAMAAGLGVVAALVLSKANVSAMKNIASNQINQYAQAHPLAAPAIATATGMAPIYSRNFPDRSNLFNSLPSPSVEHLVPFDVTGRYANVTGAYDKCDSQTYF